MNPALITGLFSVGKDLINKWFPDPEEASKREAELSALILNQNLTVFKEKSSIIKEESKSEHFLVAAWRPITMLTFVALIVAHWLGFTSPNLSEAQIMALLDIVKVGLGGYVVGRSVEKGIDSWKKKE